MKTLHNASLSAIALVMLFAASNGAAQSGVPPERCSVGDAMAALSAFYPGLIAVNEFTFDQNGQFTWVVVRPGGVGDGLANCNFRLFAAAAPFLADTYEFCSNDVFLGGNALSFPYTDPAAQQYLDTFYPDIAGYRNKAVADISLFEERVTLSRETYFDANGNERLVGDGGPEDPALTDPTAGDPKPQDLLETSYRDFFTGAGQKVVYRHEGFLAQLDAGRYWVDTEQFFAGVPFPQIPPVELIITSCD